MISLHFIFLIAKKLQRSYAFVKILKARKKTVILPSSLVKQNLQLFPGQPHGKSGHMATPYEPKPLKPILTLSKVLNSPRASKNPLIHTGEATISIVREPEHNLIFKAPKSEGS